VKVTGDKAIHIVQAGETLYAISKKYGVSVDKIKELNSMTSNTLSVGQKLVIGGTAVTVEKVEKVEKVIETPAVETMHIVESGETLYSISRKFNISVDKLKSINNLSSNNLSIGQKLKVK
ncbi:MAG: LysM peptidoglycan-binding domain-containing protein, partial [Bacteroidetes bacterium]|nr:LysM peptidoglycan-binding domain-containing protein [Bacteroidota bacterium]